MSQSIFPSLEQLLPNVFVDDSVLRHIRTLFFSSTKSNEHLANVSARFSSKPPTLFISTLLPTTYSQKPDALQHDNFDKSLTRTYVLPLVARLDDKTPPIRRPTTRVPHSLLSLFPPSASCQSSPPLQLHITLPNVRLNLSDPTALNRSAVKVVQNSVYILLTTGQSSESAGVLLTAFRRPASRNPKDSFPIEVLEPASFNTNGNVAGVWVQGRDMEAVTLALHALAAAWWTRRNRRISRVPTKTSNVTGDWFERRVWLIRFLDSNQITVQSGTISVCDDEGIHYVASLTDSTSNVQFKAESQKNSNLNPSNETHSLGEGWDSGWVTAPTAEEISEADERLRKRPLTDKIKRSSRSYQSKEDNVRRTSNNDFTRQKPTKRMDILNGQSYSSYSEDSSLDDGGLMHARMHLPGSQRRPEGSISRRQRTVPNVGRLSINSGGSNEGSCNESIDYRPNNVGGTVAEITNPSILNELDSDDELDEVGNLNIDELCQKYLNISYDEELKRHATGFSSS